MNEDLLDRATAGEEVRIDATKIEQTLAELWRIETNDEHAVTRAALWNVVAHTATREHHTQTTETLGRAAATIPQRTIVIRSNPSDPTELSSWISANCHLLGEGKQVCSEEIAIIAGGEKVAHVPPLVNALLIPDMPVAVWWVGDLPHEQAAYVDALLEPADRIIVDSVHFDNVADLAIVQRVAEKTETAPADLNWIRLEEWRVAAASLFDPAEMRQRLGAMKRLRIVAHVETEGYFGEALESLFFASWILTQAGFVVDDAGAVEGVECSFDFEQGPRRGIVRVEIEVPGSSATIARDAEKCVLFSTIDGRVTTPDAVTRASTKRADELIVRELSQPGGDRLLSRILPVAARMSRRLR